MQKIKVETTVHAGLEKVWKYWNEPEYIQWWAFASDDWECPMATNDLRIGGRFLTRMSAKDKSFSFDFTGTYTDVVEQRSITYIMDIADDEDQHRECEITFVDLGNGTTKIEEAFDPEMTNSEDKQKAGWNAILENFKKLVEND